MPDPATPPTTADMCWHITRTPNTICVTLPGGAQLCIHVPTATIPDPVEIVKAGFAQLNSALAPLMPLVRLIEFGLAVFKAVQGVAKMPWKPQDFLKALPNVIKKAQPLLALVPGMWVPYMIGGLLDLVLASLTALVQQLQAIIAQLEEVVAAETAATQLGNADLRIMADCARGQVAVQLESLADSMSPLNALLGLANLFLQLIGQQPLPTFEALGNDPTQALAKVQAALTRLQQLRRYYPV